ncbi:MAG: aminomethyltransferase family protein [bacterium]
MKTSVLFEKQQALGAVFSTYYDFQLPEYYTNLSKEYAAARNSVTIMERPYFGQLLVSGQDHVDLLHRITTNELRNLKYGEGQINIFTNEKGRIVDRVVLQKLTEGIRLITSPRCSEKITAWIDKYTFVEDVKVEDLTAKSDMLTLYGQQSAALLNSLFENDFENLPDHHFKELQWRGEVLRISRSNELGISGFNLTLDSETVSEFWDFVLDKGSQFKLQPFGEAAYETLRMEAGWPLFDKDFDENINPHEARMRAYVNLDKGCYIGQEVIARLDTYEKVQKFLIGLILHGDTTPKERDAISINDQEAGYLTSVVHSMALDKNIALGYVRTKFIDNTEKVLIHSSGQQISGDLVELPFINHGNHESCQAL